VRVLLHRDWYGLPAWRVFGVTKRMALCMCSPLYHFAKDFTQAFASALVAKPLVGQSGRYLQVRNSASEKGLSLLTRGRLQDAMMPSFSIVVFIVAHFIHCPPLMHVDMHERGAVYALACTRGGLPLSACRTRGRDMQASDQTAFCTSIAARSALSRS